MNFDLTEDQREIKDVARQFLESRCKLDDVRKAADAGSYDEGLWKEICELGWPGIATPEADGGQGLGMVELVTICEELGYACAPVPFMGSVIDSLVIAAGGSDEQRARWLPNLATGEVRGAAVMVDSSPWVAIDTEGATVVVTPDSKGVGRVGEASELEIVPLDLIDKTRSYGEVASTDGFGEELPPEHYQGVLKSQVALSAEMLGLAQRAMEMAVDYARDREQFGRPIGAYQAVSHRCAEMLYAVEETRSLVYYAAWCADAEPETLPLAAAMAKAQASEASWSVVSSSLQVHGGIGFTWEHDLQFLLKRARTDGRLLGTPKQERARVADLVGV